MRNDITTTDSRSREATDEDHVADAGNMIDGVSQAHPTEAEKAGVREADTSDGVRQTYPTGESSAPIAEESEGSTRSGAPSEGGAESAPPIDEMGTRQGLPPAEGDKGVGSTDTFPRAYVEELRDENAKFRQRAKDRDDLAQRLHVALVAATGRLADPTDLEFSDDALSDPEAMSAALDDLLERKPHLASRKPRGSVGQGVGGPSNNVDLAGILRSRAS